MMKELKKTSAKNKVEAVLFSTGHRINIDDIIRLCRSKKDDVMAALHELKQEYDDKQSSLMLVEEGDFWKFTVRDHFIPMIRKIVTETELTKSVMETLAVIAFKYPILQFEMLARNVDRRHHISSSDVPNINAEPRAVDRGKEKRYVRACAVQVELHPRARTGEVAGQIQRAIDLRKFQILGEVVHIRSGNTKNEIHLAFGVDRTAPGKRETGSHERR